MRRISNVKRPRRTPNSRRVAIFGIAFASVLVASACVNGARPRNADASTVTYTIFPSTATPKVKASTNVHSIEVGVRFSPKVAGYATGMRFYKGAGNTGPHVGTLWSSTKVVLARVTFAGESASGWQRATFSSPVLLTAGRTYFVSYHAPRGKFSYTSWYFTRSVQTTMLVAPSSSTKGNGVYAYGAGVVFPASSSLKATNFWVDVDFKKAPAGAGAPSVAPALVCGNHALLDGPAAPPAGAVVVPAGDNRSSIATDWNIAANTTYYLASGVHTLGTSQFSQIIPKNNDTFIGAPGAVIDGQGLNNFAFTQRATGVTIKFLEIRGFNAPHDQGVVNHDSGNGWTVAHNYVHDNHGAALMTGANNNVTYNCLDHNGQYGINATGYSVTNLVVDHNEISRNNTDNVEAQIPGCGCTGGVKFWDVNGATVTNNYVHDNLSVGLWADTNDRGFDFENNYISGNWGEGLLYEISYNAYIHNNTFVHNAWGKGPTNPGFPTGAIYISESGGDSRVAGGKYANFEISENVFTDNWSGVVMWENADRFCGSPNNASTGYCTLVNRGTANISTCNSTNIATAPYYDDCRWKTKNVSVHDNAFNSTAANIPGCSFSTGCGYNGVFSQGGSSPSWSPYKGDKVKNAITFHQNNVFAHNTYHGSWKFMAWDQSTVLNWSTWQAAPYQQDASSTITP